MHYIALLIAIWTGLVLVACASPTRTSVEASWRAPRVRELHYVVTMFPSPDDVLRRTVEDKLAQQLSRQGIYAVPAYTVLRPGDRHDRAQVIATLSRAGYDGIVALRMVESRHGHTLDRGLDLDWGQAWGHVEPETVVRMQIDAYALRDDQLVWSALSRSVDPQSMDRVLDDVSSVIGRKLATDRVVAGRR